MSTPFLRRLVMPATLCLAVALSACGGSDDGATPPPPAPPGQASGSLLSSAPVNTWSAEQITQALSDPDSKVQSGVAPRYAVRSHRVSYVSSDKHGQPVTASG